AMNPPGVAGLCGGVCVTVMSSHSRSFGLGRGLPLDLLDHARVTHLAPEVCVDKPPTAGHVLRTPAARLVIRLRVRDTDELGLLLAADVAPVLAARLGLAADGRLDEVRRQTFDRQQLRLALLVEPRDGTQQSPRVWHLGIREELTGVGLLDDAARVHHMDALRHARDDTEV